MTTIRQGVRAARAEKNARSRDKSISLDDMKKEVRVTQGMYQQENTFINEGIPRSGSRDRLTNDTPPAGAFDGSNTDFTLSLPVRNNDLQVSHMHTVGPSLETLTRTSNPAPAAGSFWFDGVNLVRLGTAPSPTDNIVVVYSTTR